MFGRIAHLMYHRRWYVLGIWLFILVGAASQAAHVNSILGPGEFALKGSDSDLAAQILNKKFHQDDRKIALVLIQNPSLRIQESRFAHVVSAKVRALKRDPALKVRFIEDPLISRNRQLIARDNHSLGLLVVSRLAEQDLEAQTEHLRNIARQPGFNTYVMGTPAANYDYALSSKNDLAKGETITVPILLLILLLVFGSLVAALLPLMLAVFSIVISLALVYFLGHYLSMSIYVTNVVSILGLGVGIDYSLFVVFRFREELKAMNNDVERAVVRTMETTGRAVFFSGITVTIGLSALILTRLSFMESMGIGGMLVPLTSLLVAMTLLPAVLGLLGTKISRARILPTRFLITGTNGPWHGLTIRIMARPWVSGGAAALILLILALPVTHMKFAFGSLKNAPPANSVQGYLYLKKHFVSVPDPTNIVVQRMGSGNLLRPSQVAGLRTLEQTLKRDPEATHVVGPTDYLPTSGKPSPEQQILLSRYLTPDKKTALFSVVARHEVGTKANEDMVHRLRNAINPLASGALSGNSIRTGGAQAGYADFNDAIYAKFPLIVAIILVLTYAFLFFAFRSAFLPLKAVLLNLLSVGASYGLLTIVFQGGIGSDILRFYPESGVASWIPIFLFAFLFGLSMDYEVFLLSRIRERWLVTHDNRESVAFGVEKTGRLISSAAAIMVVAFSGFLVGHEIQLKEFGFGMAASIALDASLIRIVLVPSIMELMGKWNWWVPARLQGWASHRARLEGETSAEGSERLKQAMA